MKKRYEMINKVCSSLDKSKKKKSGTPSKTDFLEASTSHSSINPKHLSICLEDEEEEDSDFVPKRMIFCLSIRKVFTFYNNKHLRFSFCLMRSLYKEFQLNKRKSLQPPRSKSCVRSVNHLSKVKISRKIHEKALIDMIKLNNNKFIKKKYIALWNRNFNERVNLKKTTLEHFLGILLRKLNEKFRKLCENSWGVAERRKNFANLLTKLEKMIKAKLFRFLINMKKAKFTIKFKVFKRLFKPLKVTPLFFEKKAEIKPIKTPGKLNLGRIRKGIGNIVRLFNLRKAILIEELNKIMNQESRKLKATEIIGKNLIKIWGKCEITRIEAFKAIKKYHESEEIIWNMQKVCNSLKFLYKSHKERELKNGFLKIFLYSQQKKDIKQLERGLKALTKILRYKIFNKCYYSLVAIRNFTPSYKKYKKSFAQAAGLLAKVHKSIQNSKFSIKSSVFSTLKSSYFYKKYQKSLQNLFFVVKSLVHHQHFKQKIKIFQILKHLSPKNKKNYAICLMKLKFILSKFYFTRITYAFTLWEKKNKYFKFHVERSVPIKKIPDFRPCSPFFSTCESKRQTPNYDNLKMLPWPKNIHDYIDDIAETAKEKSNISYFRNSFY